MGLHYENLDGQTRRYMLMELDRDIAGGSLYLSPRLNPEGHQGYEGALRDAIENHDDNWLAGVLRAGLLNTHEQRRKPKGGYTLAAVPNTAADTLAEGEFNRYYVRGLCRRAVEEKTAEVEVYRGKAVERPRPESQAMLGRRFSPDRLLEDLRTSQGVEPALGIPPGPNSGLTIRLPQ